MGHFVVTLWSPSRLVSQEFSMMPNDSKFNFAHFISEYFFEHRLGGNHEVKSKLITLLD